MILCCYPICGSEMHDAEQGQGGDRSRSLILSLALTLALALAFAQCCSLDRGTSVLSQVK